MKDLIRTALRTLGLEVRRYSEATCPDVQLRKMLERHGIDVVFDVGANTGQFALDLRRRIRYRGRIVSFEPMASAHAALVAAAARDPLWEVAPRAAIGSRTGTVTLNISGNSQSSSVLSMLQAHSAAAPDSRYVGTESVPVTTLDLAAEGRLGGDSRLFLKIDTQGYESEVLRGAGATLPRARGVQLELSLVPLYEGQALMMDLCRTMAEAGFELWHIAPVFSDPASARLLQVDATFFRNQAEAGSLRA